MADFVILDQDIMTIDPKKILQTTVMNTWFDGEEVYKKKWFAKQIYSYNI